MLIVVLPAFNEALNPSRFQGVLRGVPVDEFERHCREYADELFDRLRPDVLARARWHAREGHEVVAAIDPGPLKDAAQRQIGFPNSGGTKEQRRATVNSGNQRREQAISCPLPR